MNTFADPAFVTELLWNICTVALCLVEVVALALLTIAIRQERRRK